MKFLLVILLMTTLASLALVTEAFPVASPSPDDLEIVHSPDQSDWTTTPDPSSLADEEEKRGQDTESQGTPGWVWGVVAGVIGAVAIIVIAVWCSFCTPAQRLLAGAIAWSHHWSPCELRSSQCCWAVSARRRVESLSLSCPNEIFEKYKTVENGNHVFFLNYCSEMGTISGCILESPAAYYAIMLKAIPRLRFRPDMQNVARPGLFVFFIEWTAYWKQRTQWPRWKYRRRFLLQYFSHPLFFSSLHQWRKALPCSSAVHI